jgi:F-type H+-transporting ATPase subunit alpha
MKKVSGKIKLELAQFRELEAFMQFSQDLDPETKARIEAGERLSAALRQKNASPMSFAEQAVVIYTAVNGYLKSVAVERVPEFEEKLLSFLHASAQHVLDEILTSKEISEKTEEGIKSALKQFTETHPDLFQGSTSEGPEVTVEP